MTQPTPYAPSYSFTDFSTEHPADQQPGVQLDAQFDALEQTTDDILRNLALIQRDDGRLRNASVRLPTLHSEVIAALTLIGAEIFTWTTATAYTQGNVLVDGDDIYLVAVAHISGVLATDVAAERLIRIFDTGILTDLAGGDGASMIGWDRGAAGTVVQMLSAILFGATLYDTEFGVVADGVTDDAAATNAFFAAFALVGGNAVMKPGDRLFGEEVTLNKLTTTSNMHLEAYGVSIATTGSVGWALKVYGTYPPYGLTISGLQINDPNPNCDVGLMLERAGHVTLERCVNDTNVDVKPTPAAGVPGYKAIMLTEETLAPSTSNHGDYGCFWVSFRDSSVRLQGTPATKRPVGVFLQGAANEIRTDGMTFSGCYHGVLFANMPDQDDAVGNRVFIASPFENVTYPVHMLRRDGEPLPQGLSIDGSGFEDVNTVFMVTNVETLGNTDFGTNYDKPYIGHNAYAPNVTKLIDGPTGIENEVLVATTTTVRAERTLNYNSRGHRLRSDDAAYDTLTLEVGNVGAKAGLGIATHAGAWLGGLRYVASGVLELASDVAGFVMWALSGIQGISGTATRANNLRGTATVADAATTAVWTFSAAEVDTSYFITAASATVTGAASAGSSRIRSIAKATDKITITVEAAPGAGTSVAFDCILIR